MEKARIRSFNYLIRRMVDYASRRAMSQDGLERPRSERSVRKERDTLRHDVERLLANARPRDGKGTQHVREDRRSH
jgi:hypothetical protein